MSLFAFGEERLGRLSEPRFYLILLSIMTAIVAALMALFAIDLERNFLLIACDTAAAQNTIVNTLEGHWFRDTAYNGPNYLGQHTIFAFIPVAMIYAIYSSTDMLFLLQVLGVCSTVIPLYLLGIEILRKPRMSFLLATAALACPILLHMALAPFHPETWISAAVLWSFLFYRRNQWTGFLISLGFGLSCGEQASLIYITIGLVWLLFRDDLAWRKKYGVTALVVGLAWLVLSEAIIIPGMRAPTQPNMMATHFTNWDVNSVFGLIYAAISHPLKTGSLLVAPNRWLHLLSFVGVPLFFALFSRRSLILLAPFPFYFLMCDREFFLAFHAYYYQFAFLAAYLGLLFILSRQQNPGRLSFTLLGIILFSNILLLFPASIPYVLLEGQRDVAVDNALHEAFKSIPRKAGVYAPHRYSAYLSNRENMVMGDLREENIDFDAMIDSRFADTSVPLGDIDYIVCDLQNDQCGPRLVGFDPEGVEIRAANIKRLLQSGQWQVQWYQYDVMILRRTER